MRTDSGFALCLVFLLQASIPAFGQTTATFDLNGPGVEPVSVMTIGSDGNIHALTRNGIMFDITLAPPKVSGEPLHVLGIPFLMAEDPDNPGTFFIASYGVPKLQVYTEQHGPDFVSTGGYPSAIAVDKTHHTLYVAVQDSDSVQAFRTASNSRPTLLWTNKRIDHPSALALGAEGVYALSQSSGGIYYLFGNSAEERARTELIHPDQLIFDSGNLRLYVLSTEQGMFQEIVKEGLYPPILFPGAQSMLLNAAGTELYIAGSTRGDISIIDGTTGEIRYLDTGIGARSLARLGSRVAAAGHRGLATIDSVDLVTTFPSDTAYGACQSIDSTHLVVANDESPSLEVIRPDPLLTVSSKQLVFSGSPDYENGELSISNPTNLPVVGILPPNSGALHGFNAAGSCSWLPPYGSCTYSLSPPKPTAADQRGDFVIYVNGQNIDVPLCQPHRETLPSANAPLGIRCNSQGMCDRKQFRRLSTGLPQLVFATGYDSVHFRGSAKCLSSGPGSVCTLNLKYDGKSTSAVPESEVQVVTGCPGWPDLDVTVRVVPDHDPQVLPE